MPAASSIEVYPQSISGRSHEREGPRAAACACDQISRPGEAVGVSHSLHGCLTRSNQGCSAAQSLHESEGSRAAARACDHISRPKEAVGLSLEAHLLLPDLAP